MPTHTRSLRHRGWTVVGVDVDMDLSTAPGLRSELLTAAASGDDIAVDLRAVGFCDSIGIGILLGTRRRVVGAGRRFALVAEPGRVRDTLVTAAVIDVFDVVDDPDHLD